MEEKVTAMDRSKLVLGVAIVPFLASLVMWFTATKPVVVAAREPRRPLAFRQYAVHLGEVRPSPVVGAQFEFINRSKNPVRITSIKPSCGCLVTKIIDPRSEYRPGEFGMFHASLATANEAPGPHDYTIQVAYDDGAPHEETVRLSLTLPKPTVRLEPSEMYFYQLTGEADSRVLHVVDHRQPALNVTGVAIVIGRDACPASLATARAEKPQTVDGTTQIPIRVDVAGSVPAHRLIAHVVISTDDPEFRTLKVPVLIQGPSQPVVPASAEARDETPR
jgi:hypothetical protein